MCMRLSLIKKVAMKIGPGHYEPPNRDKKMVQKPRRKRLQGLGISIISFPVYVCYIYAGRSIRMPRQSYVLELKQEEGLA